MLFQDKASLYMKKHRKISDAFSFQLNWKKYYPKATRLNAVTFKSFPRYASTVLLLSFTKG